MLQLISLLSFLIPTQLSFHLNTLKTPVFGFNVDYLIPTVYLTDLVIFVIIFLGFKKLTLFKKYFKPALLFLVFVALNILVADYKMAATYKWLKVVEMILLGLILINTKKFDVFKNFLKPLSYSVLVCCALGALQFLNKGSIGGLFYWLGERSFVFNDPNIAPYPYSTFSHPNSFAGFLLAFGIIVIQFKNKFSTKYFSILIGLLVLNLILTNSLNVYIAIAVLFILTLKNNLLFGFLTIDFGARFIDFTNLRFITHRIELIKASFEMIKENLLLGVGLNNFIPNLVKVSNTFVNSWELQPVHNIFLLVFSETGLIGFLTFIIFTFSKLVMTNYPLIAILITGMSDHYWLTLQQNILLFVFVVVISNRNIRQKLT